MIEMTPSQAAALRAAMLVRVKQIVEQRVVPVFKGLFYHMAMRMIELEGGTPQYSGNAAANWYPSVGAPSSQYDPNAVPELQPGQHPHSLHANPNWDAMVQSQQRIRDFLERLPANATTLTLVNNTPYLREYQPYGGDQSFRAENLWPITADRVVAQTRFQFAGYKNNPAWRYS